MAERVPETENPETENPEIEKIQASTAGRNGTRLLAEFRRTAFLLALAVAAIAGALGVLLGVMLAR